MTLSRLVRGCCRLAAGVALALAPLGACAAGFSSTLSSGQRSATGLDQLTDGELDILDVLVASDLATARQLRTTTFAERFSERHSGQKTGLERLEGDQVAQIDELVADAIAAQPLPKDRPRLKDNEVVSLQRRLQVHGGMSFTLGWASGGRDFREAGAWVNYYDPATGLGLSFAFSQYSGDAMYPYGYYPYDPYYYGPGGYGAPGDYYTVGLSWSRPHFSLGFSFTQADLEHPTLPVLPASAAAFDGSGASLRAPAPPRRL